MKVKVLDERGFDIAVFGLGMSRGITSEMEFAEFESVNRDDDTNTPEYNQMFDVAHRLATKDNGENKFLESIAVWLDIDAPLFWWSQADTYRAPQGDEDDISETSGITKQSESKMYGIMKRALTQDDFEGKIFESTLTKINQLIERGGKDDFDEVINNLPESFLQRRIVKTNYKVLRHIYQQRHNHKLQEWRLFCETLERELQHPEFIRS